MQRAADPIDLESLVRDAVSGIAVAAYARGIGVHAHIDNRLPVRVFGDAGGLGAFLRAGLGRTVEAGRTGKIALAFWHDEPEPGAPPRVLLEICREMPEGERPAVGLAELWAAPGRGAKVSPPATRRANGAEAVQMPLPCRPDPAAPPVGERWRSTFEGRYILHVREILFDRERFRVSLAGVGLETDMTGSAATALELAQARAGAGKRVDMVLIDARPLGPDAVGLARGFRADPRLSDALIVLAGLGRGEELAGDEMALFDAAPRLSVPWRRLKETFHELLQARRDSPGPRAGMRPGGEIPPLERRRILIAEDVAANQALLHAILAPTGAAIETVSGGDEALRRHEAAPADLILMDLQMPGMGGLAAARRIRALGGAAGRVPIVALSAYARSEDRERARAAGMDAYLVKPVAVGEVYDLLRRMLAPGD